MLSSLIKLSSKAMKNKIMMSSGKLPDVGLVVYEITDACNSKCKHCNIWQSKPTDNQLKPDEVKQVFKDPLFRNLQHIIITGGEAFIRKDLDNMLLSIHESVPNAKMTLSTNGLLPDRVIDVVKKLLPYNLKFDVGISLDGIGEKHDEIRGIKGNFEKVERLIKKLIEMRKGYESRFNVTVAHTLSQFTADSLSDVSRYVEKYDVRFLTQLCEGFSYYGNEDDIKQENIEKQIRSVNHLPPTIHNELLIKVLRQGRPIDFTCFSLRKFFLLRFNGDMAPCLRHSGHIVGNIRESSPSDIWINSVASEKRDMVKKCQGCSNTWATSWSYNEYFFPFLDIVGRYKVKSLFNNSNKR